MDAHPHWRDTLAPQCCCLTGLNGVGSEHLTDDDVVLQDRGELTFVLWLQQAFNGSVRQSCERFVGWSEHNRRLSVSMDMQQR